MSKLASNKVELVAEGPEYSCLTISQRACVSVNRADRRDDWS